jgi:uncharacterized lipoprotein YmbA
MGGCLGRSPEARFYVLTPVPATGVAAPSAPGSGLIVSVGPVTLPSYLNRPQIVTRRAGGEVDLAELDRWAEILIEAVPRVLAEDLGRILGSDRVETYPSVTRGRYRVLIAIARFDGSPSGEVVLDARWQIVGPTGEEVAARRSAVTERVEGAGYAPLVVAMSRALGALAGDIAAVLPRP